VETFLQSAATDDSSEEGVSPIPAHVAGRIPGWLPLGFPLGLFHDPELGGPPRARIRLGGRTVVLSAQLYESWRAIRGQGILVDGTLPQAVNQDVVSLDGHGLLVRLPADPTEAFDLLSPLIPTPAGIGAGNTSRHPHSFVIVSAQFEPLAIVDRAIYAVWSCCGGGRNFGEACAAAKDEVSGLSTTVWAITALPVLTASAALFLEPAVPG
jgi:hypothetical protein